MGIRYLVEMVRLVSWNLSGRDLWDDLDHLDLDVALLQEVRLPKPGRALQVVPESPSTWETAGWERREWRTVIARLSDRVELDPQPTFAVGAAKSHGEWTVSRDGTITAAGVRAGDRSIFTAVSVYAPWERSARDVIYADGSAHRILSDLSALMAGPQHRIVVAGDWNIPLGYGEHK